MSHVFKRCTLACIAMITAAGCDRSPNEALPNSNTTPSAQVPTAPPTPNYAVIFQPLLDRLIAIQPSITDPRRVTASSLEPEVTLIERTLERTRVDTSPNDRTRKSFVAAQDAADSLAAGLKAVLRIKEASERMLQKLSKDQPTHSPRNTREILEQGEIATQNLRNAMSDTQEANDSSAVRDAMLGKAAVKIQEAKQAFQNGD